RFGFTGADLSADAVIIGEKTELFCRMASRAGSLLPDDIDSPVSAKVRKLCDLPENGCGSIVVANRNPSAKWLNLVLMATVNTHPERFEATELQVDPFSASLTAFDVFLNLAAQ